MDFRSGKFFLKGLYLLSVFCQRSGLSLLVSQAANVEIEDAFESAIAFLKKLRAVSASTSNQSTVRIISEATFQLQSAFA
jgi:hypothetical protein